VLDDKDDQQSGGVLSGRARSLVAVEAERQRRGIGFDTSQWETEPEQDPTEYVGKRVRDYFYKVQAEEDQTPAQIARVAGVDLKFLVEFNQRRWYPDLLASSRLVGGTEVLVPTMPDNNAFADDEGGARAGLSAEQVQAKREKHGQNGVVVSTNFRHWRVDYEGGDTLELDEVDVRRGSWYFRCHDEGWITTAGTGDGFVGRRVRIERAVEREGEQPFSTLATVVGYLPQGEDEEDYEMWHAIHDDGCDSAVLFPWSY
jgi:hypothetical protein